MKTLPISFIEIMQKRLGDEYASFINSYDEEHAAGLRINTLKIDAETIKHMIPSLGAAIPWTPDGYYSLPEARPGKHPFYHAGFYYIQEPSAMAPVNLLDVQANDRVLDLCAAPGGKSVQIASRLGEQGVLVTNDLHPDRTKALARNMELYGITRAVVLNERPERIADAFPEWFDKVLVDAPCSGEGMFRKDPDMVKAWEREPVLKYSAMQQEIMDSAALLVRPGGRLVYSTCTFSPEENEATIARFITKHSDYRVVPMALEHGFAAGVPAWAEDCMREHQWEASAEAIAQVKHTIRIWPHRVRGEGHYVAVLERLNEQKDSQAREHSLGDVVQYERVTNDQVSTRLDAPTFAMFNRESNRAGKRDVKLERNGSKTKQGKRDLVVINSSSKPLRPKGLQLIEDEQLHSVLSFYQLNMQLVPAVPNTAIGDYVYACPITLSRLKGLRVVRPGWFIGTCKQGRFEPSHAFALGLRQGDAAREYSLSITDEEVIPYLRGDTITISESQSFRLHYAELMSSKGYIVVMLEGSPLGWAKRVDQILKNEYPAAWRWT